MSATERPLAATVELVQWGAADPPILARTQAAVDAAAARAAWRFGPLAGRARDVWARSQPVGAVLFWPHRFADPATALGEALDAAGTPADATLADGRLSVVLEGGCAGQEIDRLGAALALLESLSPPAHAFTLAMTRRIVLAPCNTRTAFWSSSPERFLFGTRLWNLADDSAHVPDVAGALVHEAIHTWLDLDCLLRRDTPGLEPWMPPDLMSDGVSRLASPWSGAPLSLPIFVHACFVWYGLLNLWAGAHAQGLAAPHAGRLARQAWGGFLLRPDRRLQAAAGGKLSEEVRQAVAAMAARVLDATPQELCA